jgi:hypothetical protein
MPFRSAVAVSSLGKLVRSAKPMFALAILVLCATCAALLLTPFAPPAQASGGRDFAGFYALANVANLGEQVRVTFSVRVFNYSDADVTSATLILEGHSLSGGPLATFYGITFTDKESVRLSQDITVPLAEYQHWHSAQHPLLLIKYQDSNGSAQRRSVELSRGPVGEE